MITVIVGHRGVGKTSFLQRLAKYYAALKLSCVTVDLDEAIEADQKKKISTLFDEVGEHEFREIEIRVFKKVLAEAEKRAGSTFISLGAGFSGEIPERVKVWWLRRSTDEKGRIFVDRPRLNSNVSPLEEYAQRFKLREQRFKSIYHQQIYISEGWDFENKFESHLFGVRPANLNASITVLPEIFENSWRKNLFFDHMLSLGMKYFELRDDLLSFSQIQEVLGLIPAEKVLISFRNKETDKALMSLSGPYATDWAIELGPSPLEHNSIVSLHELLPDETIEEAAERLKAFKADHYKLAPMIHDFMGLWAGHRFFSENKEAHSFLPRSASGRWDWYRLANKDHLKLNFIRLGSGSAPDQPTLFEFARVPKHVENFAAVLGDPVIHSRSPAEHDEFFRERQMCMFSIQMNESECNSLNLGVLERLGLKAAAVTSPIKIKAKNLCAQLDPIAEEAQSVNTLLKTSNGWAGTNTDVKGLHEVMGSFQLPEGTAVWGGGGTRLALKSQLKFARFFSARKGEEIWVESNSEPTPTEKKDKDFSPDVLVWALGRARWAETKRPPESWRPQYVIDLNYSEDSPGLEMALDRGAKYISGKAFFKAQARAQRTFWEKELPR